jgi:hypothetical protein
LQTFRIFNNLNKNPYPDTINPLPAEFLTYPISEKPVMKKFLQAVIENTQPVSQKLLVTSFIAGYILAVIFYKFFGARIHHFLDSIMQTL